MTKSECLYCKGYFDGYFPSKCPECVAAEKQFESDGDQLDKWKSTIEVGDVVKVKRGFDEYRVTLTLRKTDTFLYDGTFCLVEYEDNHGSFKCTKLNDAYGASMPVEWLELVAKGVKHV